MRRSRTTIVIALCAIVGSAACSGSPPSAPPAPAASSAPANLANVLIQPSGYQALQKDVLSGPLSSTTDLRNYFKDHPGDADKILHNGFVSGYLRFWRQTYTGSATDPEFPLRPNANGMVLQFATPADARAILAYFRQRNSEDQYKFFPVPEILTDGFGDYLVQPGDPENPTTYTYGIAWIDKSRILNVGITYFNQPDTPAEVINHAIAQAQAQF